MFACSVAFQIRPGRVAEFTRLLDNEVLPMLRKQKGFQDEIALVAPDGSNAIGISVWDLKENAEMYAVGAYSGVLKSLEPVVDGTPHVKTYEVGNSNFPNAARAIARGVVTLPQEKE